MYYYINSFPIEKFVPDINIPDEKYIISSFYDVYMLTKQINMSDEVHHLLLKRYSQEEDYMIHRLMGMQIINENIKNGMIIINLSTKKI
jgi:hypothetical protein